MPPGQHPGGEPAAPDTLQLDLRGGYTRQHPGHLRRPEVLQDADRDQHLHREPGPGRRVLPGGHTLPSHDHEPQRLGLRQGHVQDLHGLHQRYPVHQQHIPTYHERRSLHRRLSPHIIAQNADTLYIQGHIAHRVADQRGFHDTHIPLRWYPGDGKGGHLHDTVARDRRRQGHQQGSNLLHDLQFRTGLRHTPGADSHILRPGYKETQNGGSKEQVQGEETIPQEGHETRADGDHGVHSLLVSLLANPDGAGYDKPERVPESDNGDDVSAGRVPELLEQRDEPHTVRLPQRQLQEELP